MFDGDSEQDQIRKIFRIMGTPTDEVWPGVTSLPGFQQIQWQQYERMDLKKVVKYLDQVLDESGIDLLYKLLTYDPT